MQLAIQRGVQVVDSLEGGPSLLQIPIVQVRVVVRSGLLRLKWWRVLNPNNDKINLVRSGILLTERAVNTAIMVRFQNLFELSLFTGCLSDRSINWVTLSVMAELFFYICVQLGLASILACPMSLGLLK